MNKDLNIKLSKIFVIFCLVLIAMMSTACGGGGAVRSGVSIHHDIHYRNPWYGPGYMPPPVYIGPPPDIIIPEPPLEAVPLPMDL